jgi:TRAP-type mannitol/chloroaromatic compound transport system substrate-binding protein
VKTKSPNRRELLTLAAGASTLPALATPALGQSVIKWRMVTSWPKNLPGPGVTAQRLADRIEAMSGGRLQIKLHAAGEIVPGLGVFDAIANDTVQMGHTAPLFWSSKFPAAPLFTAGPFGLTPLEHIAWINHGGGQALWDKLYEPFGVKPFMAGNTGYQMGGWYKKPLQTLSDISGLKIRMPGLGGAVMTKLGAATINLAPSEIFQSLKSGVIDATEFLGPFSDAAMGFHHVTKNYYSPGFHEPNGTGEALISRTAWSELPTDLQQIVAAACAAENINSLGEAEWNNAASLKNLIDNEGVVVRDYPADIIEAAKSATIEVMQELAGTDALTGEIVASYSNAAKHLDPWSKVSIRAYLSARG